TNAKKRRIRDSRVLGTRLLAESLATLAQRPSALVCASAAGFYDDRGDEVQTEQSPGGRGFLAGVAREWESAADAARQAGIRVVSVRTGSCWHAQVVCSRQSSCRSNSVSAARSVAAEAGGAGSRWMTCSPSIDSRSGATN